MPNSVVLLTVHADRIDADLQIPLNELQAAFGHAVNDSSAGLVARLGPQLTAYLLRHIHPRSASGRNWAVLAGTLAVHETQNAVNGTYRELTAQLQLVPPTGEAVRHFVFQYDVVLHQVMTHKILVSVRQDWARGQLAEQQPTQVGVIELDIVNNRIAPLTINLEQGSVWRGFRAMVELGMRHISEGTDHLLFLLVLLLPAPLLVKGSRAQRSGWGRFGGMRYSLKRLLLIITAFTIGHSITLLVGAMGWVRLPAQPVEILIALSILVSAVHALRPLFPGREAWVAAGFGLVHGLAFAGTLANLRLDAAPMALSILGFNLGIELMQVGIIALVIPWLILLSQTTVYPVVRITGAFVAGVAALAWVFERVSGQTNGITTLVAQLANRAPWLLATLAIIAVATWFRGRLRPSATMDDE
ncbi:HupE/UreJ family protein [Fibrella sp. HMF5405]|uniref:HupE/UreJ family protein n=2 Tax=Fibrella forsythiae TaxID=2817061 RepID=A0ABS3JIK6_9BACT|nr:HupE/UreJ family protein [Fibrella forsythiae]